MEAAFLEGGLKSNVYNNLQKVMAELGLMSQEKYDNTFEELIGGMYGCADATLLWFVRFF